MRNTRIDGQGNFSILSPELFESEDVYASNPPLQYGNTIAGAVEIKTNSTLDVEETKISIGLANVGAFISERINENNFIQAYVNRQFSNLYLGANKKKSEFLKHFSSFDAGNIDNTKYEK